MRWKLISSSSCTFLKNGQSRQVRSFLAKVPCTFSPHSVPLIYQQILPRFFPPLVPSPSPETEAGQTPSIVLFLPPGSRPHLRTSQQFCFTMFFCLRTDNAPINVYNILCSNTLNKCLNYLILSTFILPPPGLFFNCKKKFNPLFVRKQRL